MPAKARAGAPLVRATMAAPRFRAISERAYEPMQTDQAAHSVSIVAHGPGGTPGFDAWPGRQPSNRQRREAAALRQSVTE